MITVTRELLQDWRKQWMENNPVEEGRDHVTPFDGLLYGLAQPIPAVPTDKPGCYRIQIEDGAWVGTLDEWRALLKLSGTRAGKFKPYVRERKPEYGIESSEYDDMLARKIAANMAEGWECQGGVAIHRDDNGNTYYAQAMVRK